MKKNDINHLLNGLLGEEAPKPPKAPEPPKQPEKKSAASEKSRKRVEEITRNVEMETIQNRPAPKKRTETVLPKREPVPVPAPISHFSDEPSQNPAVRMRDRLDETALPMLDAERKPNQIIPPKPRPEQKKKQKKKRPQTVQNTPEAQPSRSADMPVPQSALPPKRKIPHIVIPDELPPDIPRDTTIADEIRRRKQLEAQQDDAPTKLMPAVEPTKPAAISREEEVTRKAELIKQRIRLAMEQSEAAPAEEPVQETPPAEPEAVPEPEIPAAKPKKRRKKKPAPKQPEPVIEEPVSAEEPALPIEEAEAAEPVSEEPIRQEEPAEPELPAEKPKKRKKKKSSARKPMEQPIPEPIAEPEPVSEAPAMEEPQPVYEEPVLENQPEEIVSEISEMTEPEMQISEDPVPEPPQPQEAPAPAVSAAPRLRHLSAVDEPKPRRGLFGFGSKKKQKLTAEAEKKAESAELSVFFEESPVQDAEPPAPEEPPVIPEEPEIPAVPEKPRKWERSAVQEMPEESRRWNSRKPKKAEKSIPEEKPVPEETPLPVETPVPAVRLPEPEVMPEPEIVQKPEVKPEPAPEPPASEPELLQEPSIHVELPEEKSKKISGFAASLRAALDEDTAELADEKAEPLPDENTIDVAVGKRRYIRRRTYFMAGMICSVFAVVGLAVCIMQGIRIVRDFTGSSSLSAELEDVLYPVAVVDLPDFEHPSEAAPETLLSAAMIDLLMYEDLSRYPMSFDMLSIPAQDVQARADEMFGVQFDSMFITLYAAGETFYYDAATGCYNVPASPVIFSYAPDVQEIRRAEDTYTVVVKYCRDTAQWQQRSENFDISAEKTMEITLQKSGDDYCIVRIMNISEHSEGV